MAKLAKNLLERFFAQDPIGVSLMDETNNQIVQTPAEA